MVFCPSNGIAWHGTHALTRGPLVGFVGAVSETNSRCNIADRSVDEANEGSYRAFSASHDPGNPDESSLQRKKVLVLLLV